MRSIRSLADDIREISPKCNWEDFEPIPDGHKVISGDRLWPNSDQPYTYDCYLRVGLHLNRPTQAIMACGQFIKMRKYDGSGLIDQGVNVGYFKLDPRCPQHGLYQNTSPYAYNYATFGVGTTLTPSGTVSVGMMPQPLEYLQHQVPPIICHWDPAVSSRWMHQQYAAAQVNNQLGNQLIPTYYPYTIAGNATAFNVPTSAVPVQVGAGNQSLTSYQSQSWFGGVGAAIGNLNPFKTGTVKI